MKNLVLVHVTETRRGFQGRSYTQGCNHYSLSIDRHSNVPVNSGMYMCTVKTIRPRNNKEEFSVFIPLKLATNQILYSGYNIDYASCVTFLVTNVIEIEKFPHLRADLQMGWSTTPDNTYKIQWVHDLKTLDQIEEMVEFLKQYENYSDLKEHIRYNVDHFARCNKVHWAKRTVETRLKEFNEGEINLDDLYENLSTLDWKDNGRSHWGISNLCKEISYGAELVCRHIEHPFGWNMWDGFNDKRKYTEIETEKYFQTIQECHDFLDTYPELAKSISYIKFLERLTEMGGGSCHYEDRDVTTWANRAELTVETVTIELGTEFIYRDYDDENCTVSEYRIYQKGREFGLDQKYYDLLQVSSYSKSLVKDRPISRKQVKEYEVNSLPFENKAVITWGDFKDHIAKFPEDPKPRVSSGGYSSYGDAENRRNGIDS